MIRKYPGFVFLLVFIFTIPAKAKDLNHYNELIEQNYYTFDKNKLEKILEELVDDPIYDNSWYPRYYASILHIQLGKIYYQIDTDIAYDHFVNAIDELDKISDEERVPEIYTLYSVAYGKRSSLSTLMAIVYGIKARDYIYESHEKDRNNPKTLLTGAVHLMHTPESFGGDKIKAEELLKKALKIRQVNGSKEDPLLIKWADVPEIYAYLGNLEILQENKAEAEKYFEKALSIIPDYGFIKFDLIPQLTKLDD